MSDTVSILFGILFVGTFSVTGWFYRYLTTLQTSSTEIKIKYRKSKVSSFSTHYGKVLTEIIPKKNISHFNVGYINAVNTPSQVVVLVTNDDKSYYSVFMNFPIPFLKSVDQKVDELNTWLNTNHS